MIQILRNFITFLKSILIFVFIWKTRRSGKIRWSQGGNNQVERRPSPVTSTQIPVLKVPTTCRTHMCVYNHHTIHPVIYIIYLVPRDIWIWDHCFQAPYTSTNQSPPTITAVGMLQDNDSDPRTDEFECRRSKGKAGGIFQIPIELTCPHFFCLPVCIQCFLKRIACVCFPWMFNYYCKQRPYFFLLNYSSGITFTLASGNAAFCPLPNVHVA